MRHLFSSCALGLTLALAGCGGGGGGDAAAPVAPSVPAVPDTITLQKIDNVIGTGKEAVAGSTVRVHYSGYLYDATRTPPKGTMFDTSTGRGTLDFPLGENKVIKGFEEGIKGMKAGGKRTVIIPASMGYGAAGAGNGVIPPNANLVFDIELVEVL